MPKCTIRITYEIITPESAEHGDAEERGWVDETGTEYTFQEAVRFLRHDKCVEPSSSWFHDGIWYSDAEPDRDYGTGADTYQAYHIDASEQLQRRLFRAVTGKGN